MNYDFFFFFKFLDGILLHSKLIDIRGERVILHPMMTSFVFLQFAFRPNAALEEPRSRKRKEKWRPSSWLSERPRQVGSSFAFSIYCVTQNVVQNTDFIAILTNANAHVFILQRFKETAVYRHQTFQAFI